MNKDKVKITRALVVVMSLLVFFLLTLFFATKLAENFAGELEATFIYWLILGGPLIGAIVICFKKYPSWSKGLFFPLGFWSAVNIEAYLGLKLYSPFIELAFLTCFIWPIILFLLYPSLKTKAVNEVDSKQGFVL